MRNDTETKVVITMRNVDHAAKLAACLERFFAVSDAGGDCHLVCGNDDSRKTWTDCGMVGHDVRKPIITHVAVSSMPWYLRDKYGWPIEFIKGRGRGYRITRIVFQNIRKITG